MILILSLLLPFATHAEAHYDLIVQGAGPAGLTSAIAARLSGAEKTLVIENRAEDRGMAWGSRTRSVFLSDVTVATLNRYGVEIPHTQIATWHIARGSTQRILPNRGHWKREIFAQIFHREYESIVRLGDLERSLKKRYLELGGDIWFSADAEIHQVGSLDQPALTRLDGQIFSADLMLVAEGAKSRTRQQLQIGTLPAGPGINPVYLAIDFNDPESFQPETGGSFYFFVDEAGRLQGYGSRAGGVGSFGLIHPDLLSSEEQRQKLDEMAAHIGVKPEIYSVEYRYVGELRLADSIQTGRVILIGDAARITDPTSSSGLNGALKDATHVAEFFSTRDSLSENQVLANLQRQVAADTQEIFAHALYFQNLIAWGNQSLKRLWGTAPVGRKLKIDHISKSNPSWSVHDFFFRAGSWLPSGL